jgi:hypothetical protein
MTLADISKTNSRSMAEGPIIECPRCGAEIKLTESLAAPMMESMRKQFEERAAEHEREVKEREQKLQARVQQMDIREKSMDEKVSEMVAERLDSEKAALVKRESEKARSAVAAELEEQQRTFTDMKETLESRTKKLEEAQKAQAELMKRNTEYEDKLRESDLNIQKQVTEQLETARRKARRAPPRVWGIPMKNPLSLWRLRGFFSPPPPRRILRICFLNSARKVFRPWDS